MMGKYPDVNIQIESHHQFPEFDGTGFEMALGAEMETPTTSSPNSSAFGSLEKDDHAISFAKVLIVLKRLTAQIIFFGYIISNVTDSICAKLMRD